MNPISNIWNHPKTSVAGILIAVATIAGALSRQGISLGSAGNGTVVTLVSALATALLGLLAQDPQNNSATQNNPGSSTTRLGAWALIALLLQIPFMAGCSGTTVAQDIVNWTPALQSAVATVDSTAALLAPSDAPIFAVATAGFDATSNLLVTQAKAYLAAPATGLLSQLQAQIVTFQQQVNAALLQSAKIVNPASQKHVLTVLNSVATVVNAIFALVQSISGKAAVAQMAAQSTIKMEAVTPYLDNDQSAQIIAQHYNEPAKVAQMQLTQAERTLTQAGF
jgi:hypothetical protein